MRQAGEVTYADAHKGRKNEGVIEFVSYSDMKRALEKLDGTEVNGRKIRLVEDKPGSRRRRSYSRSRSHSRYCWCLQVLELAINSLMNMCCLVAKSCPTLCDPMECSPPGPFVRGILQARILERVANSYCKGFSHFRDQTRIIAGRFFTTWATQEAPINNKCNWFSICSSSLLRK